MPSLHPTGNSRAWAEVPRRRAMGLDVLGAGLFVIVGAWMYWARVVSGGSAAPGITLLLTCGLTLIAVRTMGPQARLVVPAAVLLAAVVVASQSDTGVLSNAPLSGPFRYVNADGAFYVQAAIACLMLASTPRNWLVRALGGVGALGFAALPFIVHALAAAWLVLVLPGIALAPVALAGARGARTSVALLGLLLVASLASTVLLGASYSQRNEPNAFQRLAIKVVDTDRMALWHDAFVIMREHPGAGIGPSRFQAVSPIAQRNPDYRWAHNEFFQQGAEGGVPGLILLAAIFAWGFARLWLVRGADAITALSAASLAALGIHACVDYVMHFPAIPVVAAALVGTGMVEGATHSSRRRREQALEQDDLTRSRSQA